MIPPNARPSQLGPLSVEPLSVDPKPGLRIRIGILPPRCTAHRPPAVPLLQPTAGLAQCDDHPAPVRLVAVESDDPLLPCSIGLFPDREALYRITEPYFNCVWISAHPLLRPDTSCVRFIRSLSATTHGPLTHAGDPDGPAFWVEEAVRLQSQ